MSISQQKKKVKNSNSFRFLAFFFFCLKMKVVGEKFSALCEIDFRSMWQKIKTIPLLFSLKNEEKILHKTEEMVEEFKFESRR